MLGLTGSQVFLLILLTLTSAQLRIPIERHYHHKQQEFSGTYATFASRFSAHPAAPSLPHPNNPKAGAIENVPTTPAASLLIQNPEQNPHHPLLPDTSPKQGVILHAKDAASKSKDKDEDQDGQHHHHKKQNEQIIPLEDIYSVM